MNYPLRPGLPPLPASWKKLPVEKRGYPVPKFVDKVAGEYDFRTADGRYLRRAIEQRLCWLCGDPLKVAGSFVIGSMCAVNRTTSEPPSHLECALYAVRVCPFMVRPKAKRRLSGLPTDVVAPPGEHLDRNPGAMCVWTTQTWSWFRAYHGKPGMLCTLGEPSQVDWFAEGRAATYEEVNESVESGLPSLMSMAEEEGPTAVVALGFMLDEARALYPQGNRVGTASEAG